MQDGLSKPVAAAVDKAVVLTTSLVARLLRGESFQPEESNITLCKEV